MQNQDGDASVDMVVGSSLISIHNFNEDMFCIEITLSKQDDDYEHYESVI
jgi:hypothetical protein